MGKVNPIPPNFYATARARNFVHPLTFHDGKNFGAPSEKLLQHIWYYQRLLRDQLKTFDGRTLRVLHPGFWNREAGPDFRGAILQFNDQRPVSGDIEIDLNPEGWRTHRHDANPNYQQVLLHVVWHAEQTLSSLAKPALFVLESFLDAPLSELESTLGAEVIPWPDPALGQCAAPLRHVAPQALQEILRQAAQTRLQSKAAQFQARAKQAGWEQSLWEGLFAGLGYKKNIWPMRRLAELIPEFLPHPPSGSLHLLQTRLFGLSGLLPTQAGGPRSASYLRKIWDLWWRERDQFQASILPRALWSLHGIRPANHPLRRLALAAHWLLRPDFFEKCEKWITRPIQDSQLLPSLMDLLQVEQDDFWSTHFSFSSRRIQSPQPLLGPQRATDLAMNALLPWLWIRAVLGKNDSLQAGVEHRYFSWPVGEDNAVLKLARKRLFGQPFKISQAAQQQGLLQIVRDFCNRSNALCENCDFPQLLLRLD